MKNASIPSDIRMFKRFTVPDQVGLLENMNDKDLKRYLPYAKNEIKAKNIELLRQWQLEQKP